MKEVKLNRNFYPTENWKEMTPEKKREFRLNRILNTEGIQFISPEAEENYKIRAQRLVDVYNVREPDRVPYNLPFGELPLKMHGYNTYTAMYEPEKAAEACRKFNEKYAEDLEAHAGTMAMPGQVLDMLDYKLYAYPGKGLSKEASGIQFIEGEYMMEDEYDELILDPSDFFLRKYFPRIFGIAESFSTLQPVTHMTEVIFVFQQLMPLANPQVLDSLQRLVDAGKTLQQIGRRMMGSGGPLGGGTPAEGYPIMMMGGMTKAPFDTLADTLRGTRGAMNDMYRQPDKLLEALDKIADLTISNVLNSPTAGMGTIVTYPLHKGADGWMSQKQFETFYWPPLKKVMNAFINEGLIQHLFAEGNFNSRLESVNEFPRGTVSWLFEGSDIYKAKEILGKNCCISGNIPASLIMTGSPEEVEELCRKLIEGCGKGGGYILSCGSFPENPKLENLFAIVEAVKEYGVYKNR
jgi:hypothetical protein